MSKFRSYSIVLHNVRDDAKVSVENHFKAFSPSKLLVAMEPYPQGEGHHIHVFVSYTNPRSFKSVLSSTKSLSEKIVAPRPEGETRDWGRVQVDQMRGTFEQATAYLTTPKKEKPVDPNLTKINQAYEDAVYNYELACKKMNKIYFYPNYGEYLMVREFIERERKAGRTIDPFYQEMLFYFEKGRPVLEA